MWIGKISPTLRRPAEAPLLLCLREFVCKQLRQNLIIAFFCLGFQLSVKTSDVSPMGRVRSPCFLHHFHHDGHPIQDAIVPVHQALMLCKPPKRAEGKRVALPRHKICIGLIIAMWQALSIGEIFRQDPPCVCSLSPRRRDFVHFGESSAAQVGSCGSAAGRSQPAKTAGLTSRNRQMPIGE